MGLSTFAGGYSAHNVGAVGNRLFSVEGALLTGKALNNDTGLFID
jgi:hypothetical protein